MFRLHWTVKGGREVLGRDGFSAARSPGPGLGEPGGMRPPFLSPGVPGCEEGALGSLWPGERGGSATPLRSWVFCRAGSVLLPSPSTLPVALSPAAQRVAEEACPRHRPLHSLFPKFFHPRARGLCLVHQIQLKRPPPPIWSPWAGITKCHTLGGSHNNYFVRSGGRKFKVSVW